MGLIDVREQQHAAVRAAHEVWVLGWSSPSTDEDQRELIADALAARSEPLQRLVLVNRAGVSR